MKKKLIKGFIFMLLFTLSINFVSAAEVSSIKENGKIIKEFSYISTEKDSKDKALEDTIKVGGKTYKVDELDIKSKPLSSVEKRKVKNKEDLPLTIKKVVDGKEYTFKLDKNVKWKENKKDITITENIEYNSRGEVPNSISKNDYTLKLENVTDKTRVENVTIPGIFTSYEKYPAAYMFNGKIVDANPSPTWVGYQEDLKVGLDTAYAKYNITGGVFTTENTLVDSEINLYERQVVFSGTRNVSYVEATFTYEGEDKENSEYEATATYISDGNYSINAKVTYAEEGMMKVILKAGAGILAAAILSSIIIFILRKKKNKKGEGNE